jgi:hypothetical protein
MPDLSATRRDVLASIAVIAADISGGGGDVADPIADLQVKYYRGPFSERPNAGVENRVYETDAGAIYYDDGSSWTLVDRELNSLQIDGGPTVEAIDSNAVDQNGTLVGGGGGSSEWEVNGDGELVPKDDEPINVQSASIGDGNLRETVQGEDYADMPVGGFQFPSMVAGSRMVVGMFRPWQSDLTTSSTTYSVVDRIEFGAFPYPPGYAPVIRLVGKLGNSDGTDGVTDLKFAPRGRNEESLSAPIEFSFDANVSPASEEHFTEEFYLDRYTDSTGRKNIYENQWVTELRVADGANTGTLSSISTIQIILEAI